MKAKPAACRLTLSFGIPNSLKHDALLLTGVQEIYREWMMNHLHEEENEPAHCLCRVCLLTNETRYHLETWDRGDLLTLSSQASRASASVIYSHFPFPCSSWLSLCFRKWRAGPWTSAIHCTSVLVYGGIAGPFAQAKDLGRAVGRSMFSWFTIHKWQRPVNYSTVLWRQNKRAGVRYWKQIAPWLLLFFF